MSLDPSLPPSDWTAYYDGQLANGSYSAIVLFFAAYHPIRPRNDLRPA